MKTQRNCGPEQQTTSQNVATQLRGRSNNSNLYAAPSGKSPLSTQENMQAPAHHSARDQKPSVKSNFCSVQPEDARLSTLPLSTAPPTRRKAGSSCAYSTILGGPRSDSKLCLCMQLRCALFSSLIRNRSKPLKDASFEKVGIGGSERPEGASRANDADSAPKARSSLAEASSTKVFHGYHNWDCRRRRTANGQDDSSC